MAILCDVEQYSRANQKTQGFGEWHGAEERKCQMIGVYSLLLGNWFVRMLLSLDASSLDMVIMLYNGIITLSMLCSIHSSHGCGKAKVLDGFQHFQSGRFVYPIYRLTRKHDSLNSEFSKVYQFGTLCNKFRFIFSEIAFIRVYIVYR